MFDKIKQIKELKEIQSELKKEKIELEKDGVKVTLNGSLELEDIRLNPNLSIEEQEKAIKNNLNDAIRKAQLNLASKMSKFQNFKF
jgi:DNA-binding protein YbaB